MITKQKNINEVNPAPYNPRHISEQELKGLTNSIKNFGVVSPLIWNKQTNNIVGGNQRLKALKRLGYEILDVIEVDLNEEKEKQLNLALNNQGIQGNFNEDVNKIIEEIKESEPNIYDELRIFEIEAPKSDVEKIQEQEKDPVPDMELQPFEHYDYCVIFATNTHDWQFIHSFFDLEPVNASPVGKKKIGMGRAISVKKLKEALNKYGVRL